MQAVKYPASQRGPSYQRYLAKLRRRSKWKRRARKPRSVPSGAPVLVVEKKTKRVLVSKPRPSAPSAPSVPSRATMKEIATMRRALGISPSKARRLIRMAQRTQQPKYKIKKKKIWLPKTVQKAMR